MIFEDTYAETSAGMVAIPGDMPEWATPELLIEAASTLPAIDPVMAEMNSPLQLVDTPSGIVYLAPGAPDWVNANAIAAISAGFNVSDPFRPPVPELPPAVPSPAGVISAVTDAARALADRAGGLIRRGAEAVSGVASGVLDTVLGVINNLVPTIQELAIGLTSRFADLASNVASKTIDFGTYSFQLAVDAANAMGGVLDEAWSWILKALVGFLSVLLAPLESLAKSLTANLLAPAL